MHVGLQLTIQYDTVKELNMDWVAGCGQLNLAHVTKNKQETFEIMTNQITSRPRALFSLIFLQSCSVFHESGSDNHIHSKFSKMAPGRNLGFDLTRNRSLSWPRKPYHRTKYKVDRMTHYGDVAISERRHLRPTDISISNRYVAIVFEITLWNFRHERSVGRSSIYT